MGVRKGKEKGFQWRTECGEPKHLRISSRVDRGPSLLDFRFVVHGSVATLTVRRRRSTKGGRFPADERSDWAPSLGSTKESKEREGVLSPFVSRIRFHLEHLVLRVVLCSMSEEWKKGLTEGCRRRSMGLRRVLGPRGSGMDGNGGAAMLLHTEREGGEVVEDLRSGSSKGSLRIPGRNNVTLRVGRDSHASGIVFTSGLDFSLGLIVLDETLLEFETSPGEVSRLQDSTVCLAQRLPSRILPKVTILSDSDPSASETLPMTDRFVSADDLEDARRKRQEEWERVRKPEDPEEAPEEAYDNRSLFDRLQEARSKKQAEYDEEHRMKSMMRGLDSDETDFLSHVDDLKAKQEALRKQAEYDEEHRMKSMMRGLDSDETDFLSHVDDLKAKQEALRKQEERELIKKCKESAAGSSAEEPSHSFWAPSSGSEQYVEDEPKKSKILVQEGRLPTNVKVIGVIPGIQEYSPSSDSSNSDSEDDGNSLPILIQNAATAKNGSGCNGGS
uniref:FAM192A_Fyv6_N domain-containing protein n=1 Tax=Steinernema glaseri TaxID=37863 RepID=A0A1I7ZR56_9BILA